MTTAMDRSSGEIDKSGVAAARIRAGTRYSTGRNVVLVDNRSVNTVICCPTDAFQSSFASRHRGRMEISGRFMLDNVSVHLLCVGVK